MYKKCRFTFSDVFKIERKFYFISSWNTRDRHQMNRIVNKKTIDVKVLIEKKIELIQFQIAKNAG